MASATQNLIPVTTRIESELHRLLEEKSKLADRSVAAELRQAIRAWVEDDEAEARSDSKTEAAA